MAKAADIGSKRLISLAPDLWVQWVTQSPDVEAREIVSSEFHTKSGYHTPLIYIDLNSCKKEIWTIFIKGFWQADLVSVGVPRERCTGTRLQPPRW